MSGTFTAIVKQEAGWWIGWIEEVSGVNCQERSRDELMLSLREALLQIIDMNRQDALNAAGSNFSEEAIAV